MADLLLVEIGDNSIDVNIFNAYKSAIRADMGLGEEIESGLTDSYYDLDSSLVTAQIEIHGYQ